MHPEGNGSNIQQVLEGNGVTVLLAEDACIAKLTQTKGGRSRQRAWQGNSKQERGAQTEGETLRSSRWSEVGTLGVRLRGIRGLVRAEVFEAGVGTLVVSRRTDVGDDQKNPHMMRLS